MLVRQEAFQFSPRMMMEMEEDTAEGAEGDAEVEDGMTTTMM